ncbi:MAG TPA: signal peptidase I [Acidimicrobiales bacterium]
MSLSDDAPTVEAASPRERKSRRRAFAEWFIIVVVAVLASLFLRTFAFQTFSIPSKSMKPTLYVGNRVIVDKLSVTFGTINIGDIMVFKAPADVAKDCSDAVTDLVKRVIGVPGDHLTSKGNTIYVNGKPLNEAWSHYEPLGSPIGHVTVPPNNYFMMGDNHANSCDSRVWGSVPRSDMIGKVFLKFWPLGQWHWF